jgi:gamma-glutamylaminecyclotransferase
MDIPLFVYGSLRKTLQNNNVLFSSIFCGDYITCDKFYMIGTKSKSYPYVCREQIHNSITLTYIHGELYYINNNILLELDRMEGHPTEYKRDLITIHKDGEEKIAYMYLLESEELKEGINKDFFKRFINVPSGNWLHHV